MFLDPNTSTSLQTKLATDAHPAEGQFLLEEQTWNNSIQLIYYRANITARRPITKRAREEKRNKNTYTKHNTRTF
jgi:hypothetical protein